MQWLRSPRQQVWRNRSDSVSHTMRLKQRFYKAKQQERSKTGSKQGDAQLPIPCPLEASRGQHKECAWGRALQLEQGPAQVLDAASPAGGAISREVLETLGCGGLSEEVGQRAHLWSSTPGPSPFFSLSGLSTMRWAFFSSALTHYHHGPRIGTKEQLKFPKL